MDKLISIALPAYNAKDYIAECLDSLLAQTYQNFEIILIDDCSTDGTADVVAGYTDSRIHYFKNEKNSGIVYSLNKAYALSRGEYLARMDADDICMPERLEKQINFLEQHKDISLVSVWFQTFDGASGICRYATEPEEIKCKLLFSLQLLHPGWMFRRELVQEHNLQYREEYKYAEDWDFLVRATSVTRLSNIPEILMNYRINPNQVSNVHSKTQKQVADAVAKNQLDALGLTLTEEEFCIYRASFGRRENSLSEEEMRLLISVLKRLEQANVKKGIYREEVLHRVIQEELYYLCNYNLARKNLSGLQLYTSGYFRKIKIDAVKQCKFLLRSLWAIMHSKTHK